VHFHNIFNIAKFSQKQISTYSIVTYLFIVMLPGDIITSYCVYA